MFVKMEREQNGKGNFECDYELKSEEESVRFVEGILHENFLLRKFYQTELRSRRWHVATRS